ncbi:MAG: addiction module protein [Methyloversatilis discipulorum]|uniref:addiction module protein n=1 Tax=Methyloversatilis discipulorum TaxID=1119528 RepID=UPI0026EEF617|nr:addiction module protein [Methyloversatilis discipulorum]MBV5285958.1 addiction module protein [Methyloversatilis discipulorum]
MSSLLEELSQKARTLTADERTRLAHELIESVEREVAPDIQAAWDAEISKRVACYERGEATLIAAEDVFAAARYLTR